MAGYSGTPLAKKLGIRGGSRVVAVGAPPDYQALLAPLPDAVQFGESLADITDATDIVHAFCMRRSDLQAWLTEWRHRIRPDAVVWVSWPKKAARLPVDITEDTIRAVALPLGFVDVKVCAVTEVWSGLKLVIRKTLR